MKNETTIRAEEIAISDIVSAKINTHQPEKQSEESFKGLCKSIKESGQLVRIRVRATDDGKYEVIDGHRRLAAAKKIGLERILCDVIEGIDDDEAMLQTATANSQREDDDPIAWAELIEQLRERGMSYKAIAAKIGRDEGWVTRRARLASLTPAWRKAIKDSEFEINVETAEKIAAHEAKIQDEVLQDEFGGSIPEYGDPNQMIINVFDRASRAIDEDTQFDTSECANCPYNTACHGVLFPDLEGKARCTNRECYAKKWNEETDRRIKALREKKVEIKEVSGKWRVPNSYTSTPHKTPKNRVPYVYQEGNIRYLVWSVKDETRSGAPALTAEEKEAARAIKRAHKVWSQNRRSAYDKIRDKLKDEKTRNELLMSAVETARFRDWAYLYFKRTFGDTGYVFDGHCQQIYEMVGAETLNTKYGCDITSQEVDAMAGEDPATEKKGGE